MSEFRINKRNSRTFLFEHRKSIIFISLFRSYTLPAYLSHTVLIQAINQKQHRIKETLIKSSAEVASSDFQTNYSKNLQEY